MSSPLYRRILLWHKLVAMVTGGLSLCSAKQRLNRDEAKGWVTNLRNVADEIENVLAGGDFILDERGQRVVDSGIVNAPVPGGRHEKVVPTHSGTPNVAASHRKAGGLRVATRKETMTTKLRCYVLLGQGDEATSMGMVELARRLALLLGVVVTTHHWNQWQDVVNDIPKHKLPVALIGYSLGANATTWISHKLPGRVIELIVAYDPSVYSVVLDAGGNVVRGLLYHNGGHDIYGHAVIKGRQVVVTEITEGHLMVDFDQSLHVKTIEAVKQLLK